MNTVKNLTDFIKRLDAEAIHYTIDPDRITVRIEVWGQRWVVRFTDKIEVEVFSMRGGLNAIDPGISKGKEGPEALERLFKLFSDFKG